MSAHEGIGAVVRGRMKRRGEERPLLPDVGRTTTVLERMRGLLGRPPLGSGEGLLIEPCASIHTAAMGYDLDVVYLDRRLVVRKVVHALKPWRLSGCPGARMTLELESGAVARLGIAPGDVLEWEQLA